MRAELYDLVARTGKAFSSGRRLELLELIAQGERGVQDLAETSGMNVTTTSAHLQVLRHAGLVRTRRDAQRIYYRLAGDDVAAVLAALLGLAERHRPEVATAREEHLGLDDRTRLLDRAELVEACERDEVLLLDVRPSEEFDSAHLDGARSIPLPELRARIHEIPPDVHVVAYCRGRNCVMSHEAARWLRSQGREASVLSDGVLEWRSGRAGTAKPDPLSRGAVRP